MLLSYFSPLWPNGKLSFNFLLSFSNRVEPIYIYIALTFDKCCVMSTYEAKNRQQKGRLGTPDSINQLLLVGLEIWHFIGTTTRPFSLNFVVTLQPWDLRSYYLESMQFHRLTQISEFDITSFYIQTHSLSIPIKLLDTKYKLS